MIVTKFLQAPLVVTESVAPLTVAAIKGPLDITALPTPTPEQVKAEMERREKLKQQMDALLARRRTAGGEG